MFGGLLRALQALRERVLAQCAFLLGFRQLPKTVLWDQCSEPQDYSSHSTGDTCIYARSVRKSGRGKITQKMNQAPPPIPVAKRKNKGCIIALSAVFGVIAILFIIGSIILSLGKKAFEANRPEIIAEARAAVSAGDYEKLEELGKAYSFAKDRELQGLVEEVGRIKEERLVERLGTIHPFKIYEKEDSSFGERKRLTWRVVVPKVERPEDYGATLIYAAKELHRTTKAETASIVAEMSPESIENGASQIVAVVNYIPDGKGWSGEDESEVWNVRLPANIPSPKVVQAHAIYAEHRTEILNNFGDDFRGAEEESRRRIAGEMKITKEEAGKLLVFAPPQASDEWVYQDEPLTFRTPKVRKQIAAEVRK